jgi:hypothetical protein
MRKKSALPLVVSIAACYLILIGCTNLPPPPTSDSTPPVLTWFIHNETTGDSFNIPGSGRVDARANDTFSITLKVEDPQGVKFIQLGSSFTKTCRGGAPEFPASNASGGLGVDSQSLSPDSAGHVLPAIILIRQVAPSTNCPPNMNWTSYKEFLEGLGSNYFSGNTSASLLVSFTP